MPKVLVVSYPFPPAGGIGVPRALAYARYLPRLGCETWILAPRNPAVPVYDPELIKLVPPETHVVRAFNPELPFALRDKLWARLRPPHGAENNNKEAGAAQESNVDSRRGWKAALRRAAQSWMFPDAQRSWNRFAIRKAGRLIEREAIAAVVLNVNPYSTLQIGIELKRRYPHIKLIADFRDEWLGYYLENFDSPSDDRRRRAAKLEREAIEACDFVSTVTEDWVQTLRARYPEQPATKFLLTPNGYDPEMFADFHPHPRGSGKMQLAYFGTLHANKIYSPINYFAAIDALPEEIRGNLNTRFIGRVTAEAQTILAGRTDVECCGFMSKLKGLRELESADVLLLIATGAGSHAGKLFDYLATGKPILALSPPQGEIGELLRATRAGLCVDPWDVQAITAALADVYAKLAAGRPIASPDQQKIEEYSWPRIMRRLLLQTGIIENAGASAGQGEPALCEAEKTLGAAGS
jgi:glycosyltransferase involved in cell wall biosynthesis